MLLSKRKPKAPILRINKAVKSLTLLSPIPAKEPLESGITIRIKELAKLFQEKGVKCKILTKIRNSEIKSGNAFYVLISTKADSISSQILQKLGPEQILIVDLYTPIFLEKNITISKWSPKSLLIKRLHKKNVARIISRGNYFLVANSRQKDYWIKTSASLKVPLKQNQIFVFPTTAPQISTKSVTKKKVILWFGGIYPWMNPEPLIRAFAKISKEFPEWKLRILGGFHPKTGYDKFYKKITEIAVKTIPSNQLELLPWQVSKNLPSKLEDVAFCANIPKNSPEDYYSHRARLMTLLSCNIPILTAGNDTISNLILISKAGEQISSRENEIANTLTKLIKNPKKLESLSKNTKKVEPLLLAQRDSSVVEKLLPL